ncbi:molybdopterin-binding protein [Paractinoplanes deccanensis]|uniref:Molybdopterin-binding protein n=1 Tax=Paractinoplanes deccanensis TaxID=113561 RepID=A0ABQ3XWU3_9ACTN|nr:molybdopterin-dependent oxidoreductase [Actinoplanes deccanensis]GID72221.1 molybdopterin-binding protein [Actinoplanes deccanensis]
MVRDAGARLRQVLTWPSRPPRWGPWRPGAFGSPLRSTRLTSLLGVALGAAFGVCFVTGVLSHLIQHPPGWFWWPSRPVGLYRFTQGLHVATGLATVPLLGAKLWSVYPRLFAWPPVRGLAHAAERLGVAALVAAALFQVVTGVLNVAHWYAPMPFFFTAAHYWVAWLAIGALLTHIGVQLPAIRGALSRATGAAEAGKGAPLGRGDRGEEVDDGRRRLLRAVGVAAGVITVATVGQTVRPLARVSVLAPRRPGDGPQGLPVNRTADAAGVRAVALDPAYRLVVSGFGRDVSLSLADLGAMPQHTASLPIACVEGWSATGTWTGVRLRDLAALLGADPHGSEAEVESLQAAGRYRTSVVASPHLADGLTLLALRLGGEPLALDHGFPVRLIAPNRPGVLQTKWVGRITVRRSR